MTTTDDLKTLTDCSICYNTLLEPKILPCGHTFCLDCVKRLYQTGGSHVFECPECRAVHEIPHTMIPTDFKLKQVVEMMHRMCKDQAGGKWRSKICSQCAACGDIKNYFICETCADGDLMQVYCSLCIVKKHQSHSVREALDEAKVNLYCALDNNMSLIDHIKHDTEFYNCRYTAQNKQISSVRFLSKISLTAKFSVFQMFSTLCEKTKESIKDDFKIEHVQMSDVLGRFLEKARDEIIHVFNDSDNRIFQLSYQV